MEATPHLHLVDTATGEVTETCEHCLTKDRAIERLTRSYEGTLQGLRQQVEGLQDDRDASFPFDEAADVVMRRWHELAIASRWFKQPPATGATSTRWRDTKRALRGTKAKSGDWDWPPRSVADLLVATRGAFIRAEEQRRDRGFKRDYIDPCTAFFSNFDRNFEAASDPSPRQGSIALVFAAPAALRDRWAEVLDLADVCDRCDHIRMDHQKPSLQGDGMSWGGCLVHGCHCGEYDDFWFQSERWLRQRARPQS